MSNIARRFGKDLNKEEKKRKEKHLCLNVWKGLKLKKNNIGRRFETDLEPEKKNDKQSNIARRLGKDLKQKSGAVNKNTEQIN